MNTLAFECHRWHDLYSQTSHKGLINKLQTAIIWNEYNDLFAVLYQLDSHTFSDSRIGLFGLNTYIFEKFL